MPLANRLSKEDNHKGSHTGEIVNGDHIIPRSVCSVLDNSLYNLETIQLTFNRKKSAKIGQRKNRLS